MDTTLPGSDSPDSCDGQARDALALVVAWCRDQPDRIGEICFVRGRSRLLGRGARRVDDPAPRLAAERQRPGIREVVGPFQGARISRAQLVLEPRSNKLNVQHVGRCATRINGVPMGKTGELEPGDTLLLDEELLMLCVRRAPEMVAGRYGAASDFAFGEPDAWGMVGESPAAWSIREQIAFVAPTRGHVLITGPTGVGKELVAQALHALSSRREASLVSRNAATLPTSLIDAELFGHVADYPNAGAPARVGIIGQADGGTLFLDEIGELSSELQAHLLRVLDSGEFQRLGDPQVRRVDIRLVAATNRAEAALKHDLVARLKHGIAVPGLNTRAEDIPLLLRALARRAAEEDSRLAARFSENGILFDPQLVDALVRHSYVLNIRELDSLLWLALGQFTGQRVGLTPRIRERLRMGTTFTDPSSLTAERIREALDACGGNQQRTYRMLNLKNRDLLYRLLKKHNISRG